MAFNIYFAGSPKSKVEPYIKEKRCCRLFSQIKERSGVRTYAELPDPKPKLMVDSGAFSVAHSGKTVNLDEYIAFINTNDSCATAWVQLDSIPYPELNASTAIECSNKSWENYLYMVERVKTPEKLIPVYHFGEPKENLLRILNTPIKALGNVPASYIGVGGRHGVSTNDQRTYFEDVFNIIKSSSNPDVKVHAFGMTVLSLLEQFPFYSADSTTWIQLAAHGSVVTDHGIFVVSDRQLHRKENVNQLEPKMYKVFLRDVEKMGYTLEELQTDHYSRYKFNIDYYQNWAENYTYKGVQVYKRRLI